MKRIHNHGTIETFNWVLSYLPPEYQEILKNTDIVCGVDPIFIGLSNVEKIPDGRSYRTTSHVNYAHRQIHMARADRKTTMVINKSRSTEYFGEPFVVLHELGHVLHEFFDLKKLPFKDVDWYAATHKYENFSQSFTTWAEQFIPAKAIDYEERLAIFETDPYAKYFFENLLDNS